MTRRLRSVRGGGHAASFLTAFAPLACLLVVSWGWWLEASWERVAGPGECTEILAGVCGGWRRALPVGRLLADGCYWRRGFDPRSRLVECLNISRPWLKQRSAFRTLLHPQLPPPSHHPSTPRIATMTSTPNVSIFRRVDRRLGLVSRRDIGSLAGSAPRNRHVAGVHSC